MLNQGNLTEGKLKRKFLYNSMVTDQNLFQIPFNSVEYIDYVIAFFQSTRYILTQYSAPHPNANLFLIFFERDKVFVNYEFRLSKNL